MSHDTTSMVCPLVTRQCQQLELAGRVKRKRSGPSPPPPVLAHALGEDWLSPSLHTFIPRVWPGADAGFPAPAFLRALEAEEIPYVCRIRSNAVLECLAAPLTNPTPGRPSTGGRTWFHELSYRAGKWKHVRRLVLVFLEHADEQQHLFLDHFFLRTSASVQEESAEALLECFRQGGNTESDVGAFKSAIAPTLSSVPRPKSHYQGRVCQEMGSGTSS